MDLRQRLSLPHIRRLISSRWRQGVRRLSTSRPFARNRLAGAFLLALTLLLAPSALFSWLAPTLTNAPAVMPAPVDTALSQLGIRDDAYAFLQDLGLYPPGQACAGLGCQAWYCDLILNGQCHQHRGGGYVPTNPVGCVGSCSGGGGVCSGGSCPDGRGYNCCAQSGNGGCGPLLMGVRGSDCCGAGPGGTPPPRPPTPTGPCNGERIDVDEPRGSYTQEPRNAVVVGQDPGVKGFTLRISASGGKAELWQQGTHRYCANGGGDYPKDCPNGPSRSVCEWDLKARYDDPLIKVELALRLHESTIAWIDGPLAGRYRGAQRKEPLPKQFTVWQGHSMSVHQNWKYLPSDPGVHGGRIILTTAGTPISPPQQVSVPVEVPVYLKDTTLWEWLP